METKNNIDDRNILSILIIDDDEVDRLRIIRFLNQVPDQEFQIDEVFSATGGVEAISKKEYDCILLDFNLTDGNAIDVLDRIQAIKGESPPIILQTVLDDEKKAIEVIAKGAQDYLIKGRFDAVLLWRTIQYSIQRDSLIKERQKLSKELQSANIRVQNLESLGTFAGGIAHDFNNLLASIMGNASIMDITNKEENIKKNISRIIESSRKANSLTQKLLTFAKGGNPVKSEISIRKLVEDSANYSLSGSDVKAEFQFRENLIIEADPDQLSQAIQNLITNAKESMLNSGIIKISTEDTFQNNQSYIKIVIQDRGVGIPKENIDKIFNPYFSTKPRGEQKGCGLGLSVCYSIIRNHGGEILVQSQVGKGTTFELLLPAYKKDIREKEIEVKTKRRKIGSQKLKILVMDDEELIREFLEDILTLLNHKVITSVDGEEAIQLYKEAKISGNGFDLIIMDLTIKGGMGGKEAVKILREFDPDAKVIVSSGYSDSSTEGYKRDGFDAMLKKPYSNDELDRVIFDVMNIQN